MWEHYDFYPVTQAQPFTCLATTLAIISPIMWHDRLGHLGTSSINFLRNNNYIICNKDHDSTFYNSCQIGKHIKLHFYESTSATTIAFDIIHADLWTSPIYSSSGNQCYLILIDDFTPFAWIVPLAYKSRAYQALLNFHAMWGLNLNVPLKPLKVIIDTFSSFI